MPKDPEKVYFVDKDKKILIHYRSSVVVINISDNKQFTQEISHMCQLCVCGPNRSIFGTFLIRDCSFFSVIDGAVKNKLTFDSNKNLFDIQSIISGKYISYMYYSLTVDKSIWTLPNFSYISYKVNSCFDFDNYFL